MAKVYDVVAQKGSYKGADGQERPTWLTCGAVVETRNGGLAMNLDALPINFNGWFMLKTPKPKEAGAGGEPTNQGAGSPLVQNNDFDAMEDDIPF